MKTSGMCKRGRDTQAGAQTPTFAGHRGEISTFVGYLEEMSHLSTPDTSNPTPFQGIEKPALPLPIAMHATDKNHDNLCKKMCECRTIIPFTLPEIHQSIVTIFLS